MNLATHRWSPLPTVCRVAGLCAMLAAGCGDGVNTPELQAAIAKARPLEPQASAASQSRGAPLPLAGAQPHIAKEALELALHFKAGTQKLRIERTIIRAGTHAEAPFKIEQVRHWTHPTSHDEPLRDGRTAVFDGQRFASRRGTGPWRERETWRGDHHAWVTAAYATGDLVLQAYSPLLTLSRKGAEDVVGLKAERFVVRKNGDVRIKRLDDATIKSLRDTEGQWFQWLAATHRPESIEGSLLRRAGGTELVAGSLTFKGQASVEGTTVAFTLSWTRTLKEAAVAAKDTAVPSTVEPAHRERPWFMIRSVVKGELADVYAKRARR